MNGTNEDRLYNLLPAHYRRRDQAEGEPLRALISVLESQFQTLEADIAASYNNWFVETCDDWVLPYLAELVGMSNLRQEKQHTFSTQRRQVANTIAYRCRKGTIAALEHVVRDVTGWLACAVEFDQRLAVTHRLERMPREQERTVDVRREDLLAALGGPFDKSVYTVEMCTETLAIAHAAIPQSRRYAVGRLGLFCWRLRSFRMTNSHPRGITIPRLLDFLNQAKDPEEIVRRLRDDPEFGDPSKQAYGVRPSLARRILEKRDRLPGHRFESLEQVDDVPGVGPDTLHDMLAGFSTLYTFHPLGVDMPLFNWPQYIAEIDQRAGEADMPLALSRSQFKADLEEYEKKYGRSPEAFQPSCSRFYGPDRGLNVALWPPDKPEPSPIPPSKVLSMDLSQWDVALADQVREKYPGKEVAIDVELGRMALLNHAGTNKPIRDEDIQVTYCYGFSTSMGGGPYHRDLRRLFSASASFHIDVAKGAAGKGKEAEGQNITCVPALVDALKMWNDYQNKYPHPRGVIRILDNGLYDEQLEIRLYKGSDLVIVADNGTRPVIGDNKPLTVVCEGAYSEEKRQLDLSGLLIHGGLSIEAGAKGWLVVKIEHCTLATTEDRQLKPTAIKVELADEQARGLDLSIEHSIVGPLYLPKTMANLKVINSVIDNGSEYAVAADPTGNKSGPVVNLERSTIFGQVHAQKVTASDVIFVGPLRAPAPETKDQIKNSYVPQGSPPLGVEPHSSISGNLAPPRFTSTHYGDPGYAQLSLDCPREIRGGAADGSEMGAFHDLYQLQAEENLREALDEYLPLGLHASIHYVT